MNVFDNCNHQINRLLNEHKLYVREPYRCKAQYYFCNGADIYSAIVVSSVESEVGLITRAWGTVFTNPSTLIRCTNIHVSYYGQNIVLEKLLKELNSY